MNNLGTVNFRVFEVFADELYMDARAALQVTKSWGMDRKSAVSL